MNAAETIQAAIDKLTEQRGGVEPWWAFDPDTTAVYMTESSGCEVHVLDAVLEEDRDLIVTLHRTIAAQLAILQAASNDEYECAQEWAEMGKPHLRGPAKVVPINRAALVLAKAILGDTA